MLVCGLLFIARPNRYVETMIAPARYAIYYTPAAESDLARLGAALLGYDCHAGIEVAQPRFDGVTHDEMYSLTAEPRRYGFHGTLKAPFVLRAGVSPEDLKSAVRNFASEWPTFQAGTISPRPLGHFIALTPDAPSPDLSLFAAECVAALDEFRAPVTEEERQRRKASQLSPRRQVLLERWGYPYVFDQFRFHMTLTGTVPEERREAWMAGIHHYIGGPRQLAVDAVTLLIQPSPEARFRVIERYELTGRQ